MAHGANGPGDGAQTFKSGLHPPCQGGEGIMFKCRWFHKLLFFEGRSELRQDGNGCQHAHIAIGQKMSIMA